MSKIDIYEEVTAQIVSALEAGVAPWVKPWKDGAQPDLPYNASSGREYNGINQILLGMQAYSSNGWLTFKQAKDLGGSIRKGEKSTIVVYWQFLRQGEDGDVRTIPLIKAYRVFNLDQCEGIDEGKLKRHVPAQAGEGGFNAVARDAGAIVNHGGSKAFYNPSSDHIVVPSIDVFTSASAYEATLAHELVHWTGHKSRCNREFGKRFGNEAYAFEELVAEIGAAFACARLGVEQEGLQHAEYVSAWLKVLKDDKRAIFTAASKARDAVNFLFAERIEDKVAA